MKLSFLSSIKQFAITHLGVVQDSDNDMTALMQRNGMLSDSDGCDGDEDFDDFDSDDFDLDAVPQSHGVEAEYIDRHIARIPQYGDKGYSRDTGKIGHDVKFCNNARFSMSLPPAEAANTQSARAQ